MRTVHSVINTSPPELLADIVLVDDYSNKDHLKEKLEKYIQRFNGKVKLVRTTQREGLVRARVIGAENAGGDVIIVLDAHCECVQNWLPPLLTRIAVNRYNFLILFTLTSKNQ
jgi:polypeptide N-acetylgalactosaminyltransferase